MRLNSIAPRPGAKHRRKRLGCGESSGHGKTCGKGHKGQNSRSGGSIRIGFEGGQMPIHRRLPKKGFNNSDFAYNYAVLNVSDLEEAFEAGTEITEAVLREARIVKGRYDGVKLLGNGEVKKNFTVSLAKISASAREKIQKAGGKVVEAKPAANE